MILAADSRWSHDDGGFEDDAVKVFALAPNCIASYSGRAGVGEDRLNALARSLRRTDTIEEFATLVQEALRDSYNGGTVDREELEIMLGVSARSGAWGATFRASEGYEPCPFDSVVCAAPERVKVYCEQAIRAMIYEAKSLTAPQLPPFDFESWGSLICGLIDEVGRLQLDPGVGGRVTCAGTMGGRNFGLGATMLIPTKSGVDAEFVNVGGNGKTVRRVWEYGSNPPAGRR